MRHRATRTVVVTVALMLGFAGSAYAASFSSLSTTGASFTGGTYSFDPWPCTSACGSGKFSGMNYSGTLKDTNASDGNQVFVHAKVDAYGWSAATYTGSSLSVSRKVTGGADPSMSGQIEICRDRGALLPNNCVASPKFTR